MSSAKHRIKTTWVPPLEFYLELLLCCHLNASIHTPRWDSQPNSDPIQLMSLPPSLMVPDCHVIGQTQEIETTGEPGLLLFPPQCPSNNPDAGPPLPLSMASNIITTPHTLCFAIPNGIEHWGCFLLPSCPATSNDAVPTASASRISNNMDWPIPSPSPQQAASSIITIPHILHSAMSLDVECWGCFPWHLPPSMLSIEDISPGMYHFTFILPHCPSSSLFPLSLIVFFFYCLNVFNYHKLNWIVILYTWILKND